MKLSELYDEILDEDYPPSFNMDKFKELHSFASRVRYCQEHLQRISSGSARIVYQIDEEKVLKLARNNKGLAQNEVEIDSSNDYYLDSLMAKVFDHHERNLWLEMELAQKVSMGKFKQITGFNFRDYCDMVHNYGVDSHNNRGHGYKISVDPELMELMWDNEFTSSVLDYIGNYDVGVGDLQKLSTYGIVKRDGVETIVLIDYGLTPAVYDSHYKR